MSGLDNIINRILNDARAEADAVIREGAAEAARIREAAEKERARLEQESGARAAADRERILRLGEAADRQEAKSLRLAARAGVIEEAVERAREEILAMDPETYADFLLSVLRKNVRRGAGELYLAPGEGARLPADFAERCRDAAPEGAALSFCGEEPSIPNGFLLRYGNIEQNCSIDGLFDAMGSELRDRAFACLSDRGR